MRFPILMSPLWRPLLLPFGATQERSYLEIQDGELHARFGWLFDGTFALADLEGASPSHWSIWGGIGWRTNFRGNVGLIGTYVNIVEVRFKEPQRVRMVLPTPCRRLYVSLQDPRAFIAALQRATGEKAAPKKSAPKKSAKRPAARANSRRPRARTAKRKA